MPLCWLFHLLPLWQHNWIDAVGVSAGSSFPKTFKIFLWFFAGPWKKRYKIISFCQLFLSLGFAYVLAFPKEALAKKIHSTYLKEIFMWSKLEVPTLP